MVAAARASARVNELLGASARALMPDIDPSTLAFVRQLLRTRYPPDQVWATNEIVADIALITTSNDAGAGERMLAASANRPAHRLAWSAIAAEGLLGGSDDQRVQGVEILMSLALHERIAEAAARLTIGEPSFLLDRATREKWHAFARDLWPPSVGRSVISFAGHYLVHLLAAAEPLQGDGGWPQDSP